MHRLLIAAIIMLLTVPAFGAEKKAKGKKGASAEHVMTEDEKLFYAVGLSVARQLAVFKMNQAEFDMVKQGLADGLSGKTPISAAEPYMKKIQEVANARRGAQGGKQAVNPKDFMAKAAREKGAVKTASGMIYVPLRAGTGVSPKPADTVKVNYRGTLIDGKEFDSSYTRGTPAEFPLNAVIKCWTEGVGMMKAGGKAKLICPPPLAYGEHGSGAVPANATLVFEVELLDVKGASEAK